MNISISYEERISLEDNGILDTHVFVLVRFYLDNFCPKIAKKISWNINCSSQRSSIWYVHYSRIWKLEQILMLKLLNWPELHWWLCTKYHTSTYRSSIQYTQTIDYRYSIVARYKGVSSKFKFLLVFWGFEVRCCKLALWNDCLYIFDMVSYILRCFGDFFTTISEFFHSKYSNRPVTLLIGVIGFWL